MDMLLDVDVQVIVDRVALVVVKQVVLAAAVEVVPVHSDVSVAQAPVPGA